MHGNHHHHHQRTDLGGIMPITRVFIIGPFVPCTPLCKILNMPVMSICLVKQNDRTWVEKHQRFLFNVYKRFCHVFYVFNVFYFFWNVFLHLCLKRTVFQIFDLCRDLEIRVKGHSKSSELTRIDPAPMTSYQRYRATMDLSRTVSEINGDFSRKSPIFPTPEYLTPPLKGFPLEFDTDANGQKLE